MSRLGTRVLTLERRERRGAGCPWCGGRGFHIQETDESPAWLDTASRCRGCGSGIKIIDLDAWDRL